MRARIAPAEDRCLQAPNDESGIEDWSNDDAPLTWEHTLQRLRSMKVVFDRAVELDDFQDVARRCREIIIEATDLVHEPWMVPADEEPPKKSDAKNRMDQICAQLLVGPTHEHVRGVLKETLALAQYVTHGSNVTQLEALAAAQSTLMVVLTLRELQRLAQELAEIEESDSALGPDEDFADYAAEYWHQGGAEDESEDPPGVQLYDQTEA